MVERRMSRGPSQRSEPAAYVPHAPLSRHLDDGDERPRALDSTPIPIQRGSVCRNSLPTLYILTYRAAHGSRQSRTSSLTRTTKRRGLRFTPMTPWSCLLRRCVTFTIYVPHQLTSHSSTRSYLSLLMSYLSASAKLQLPALAITNPAFNRPPSLLLDHICYLTRPLSRVSYNPRSVCYCTTLRNGLGYTSTRLSCINRIKSINFDCYFISQSCELPPQIGLIDAFGRAPYGLRESSLDANYVITANFPQTLVSV